MSDPVKEFLARMCSEEIQVESVVTRALTEGFLPCACLRVTDSAHYVVWSCPVCAGAGVVAPAALDALAPHVRPAQVRKPDSNEDILWMPASCYADRVDVFLARVLAALTGEPETEWRRRTLVWPDVTPDPARRYGTIHMGGLLRWRIDEPANHYSLDSYSSLPCGERAAEAWALLVQAHVVAGPMPVACTNTREVIRYAVHQRGRVPADAPGVH